MATKFQFRLITGREKQKDILFAAVRTMGYMSLLSFSLAKNEMLNAYLMLRDQPDTFRQRVKMLANQSIKESEIQMCNMNNAFEAKGYWFNYSDAIIDAAENDVTRFRIAMKQELDKMGEPRSQLIAQIETARVLLDTSVMLHDQIVKEIQIKCGKDFTPAFAVLRCTSTLESWNRLCAAVKGGCGAELNTPQTEACYDVLVKKFAECKYAELCGESAKKAIS